MNTPISLKIAKLLKEKGFDLNHKYMFFTSDETEKYPEGELSLKPTIAEVVMWLYEKHGIWIDVVLSRNRKQFTFMIQSLGFDEDKFLNEYYNSPTEAYEAAIEFSLKNLI